MAASARLRTRSRRFELGAFGFAVALLVFVQYLGHRSTTSLVETAGSVQHTREVIGELDALLLVQLDAETARRGYALTGDERLLEPARDAASRTAMHFAALRRLTSDSPEQAGRLDDLERHVASRLRILDEAVAAQRAGVAQLRQDTLRGRGEMDLVRAGVAAMIAEERRLLAARERATVESISQTRSAQLGGGALSVAMLALVVMRLRREVHQREASEARTRENEGSLRRAKAFLDTIVDNIPDMIFVKDARDLAFVRFNRAGEKLLGVTRADLIGKTDFAFFPAVEAQAFVDKDRETLRTREVVDIPEEPLSTPSGTRWLHTKKVPIYDEAGEPEYLLGISADITDRRVADGALRASKDATEVAHRELEAFSYSVAHDLRSPLRSIEGFSQAILDDYADKLDDQGKDYLSRVRNAARRMAELIDALLGLARVSRSELSRVGMDLTALAREVGAVAKRDRNPNAELVVADGLSADADPRLVRVLLENLMSNAFKFSNRREGARVEVGKSKDGAFFVKDNGAGFDLTNAQKLFTAFQRYHRPTEYEGTGIGLATSERIVSRHGGRIWADSAPDAGATFHFILERRKDETQ